MSSIRLLGLLAAAMALPATLLALPAPDGGPVGPGTASLAGQLLIAAPSMADPRFDHTVILMVRHDPRGALGIIVNRPVAERSLASLLQALGDTDASVAGSVRIFAGGPVQPDIGFVIHSADYHRPDTVDIDSRLAMTSSREILHDIANRQGPDRSLVAFGYAGWAGGQLEGEMSLRAWFTAPANPTLIFEEDRDKVWDEAMKRRTRDL
ncbi:MAG: YqgE/AlgH family protein [Xanthobacteraceae bacterium]